jgi:23S rRNA (guanosine2251-2'-O)-methyltransferase
MRKIVLIAHNLRSTHNVGSLLRTAEGLGVEKVYLTGYTPYPSSNDDNRLPHLARKITAQINKTALGAENTLKWEHSESIESVIANLKQSGFTIACVEQTDKATKLSDFVPPKAIALIVGREVEGIEPEVLEQANLQLVIPMFGQKESFNVVQAAAMALYHIRFA